MATFTEEDGTGLEDSNSYSSLAFSEEYLGDAWAASDGVKEAALMAATEYLDLRWGSKLRGIPLAELQALEFPRSGLYDRYGRVIEGIPQEIAKATCLYAAEHVAGTLYPNPSSSTSKDVKRKKTVVGPITTEVEYQGSSTDASWLSFPKADKFVKEFITQGSQGVMRN